MMASESLASVEWERAQQVEISVDLISAAKQELGFLAVVDKTPALKNHQVLEHAVDRYLNCWLPLANRYTPRDELLPPLDCAWVWHCHKLNPVQYAKDCHQLFGKLVDVGAPRVERKIGEAIATDIWNNAYPGVPYNFVRASDEVAAQQQNFGPLPNRNTVAYDLIAAIERQTSFYFQVCRPWMYEDRFLQVALQRYRGFLHLIKLAKEKEATGGPRPFVVPTYDIDLLWHSHQLCPTAYRADTVNCMGKILDHDDSDSNREAGAKLQTSFLDTCEQWVATYGRVYEQAGSLYKGSEPARAAPPTPNLDPDEVVMGFPVSQKLLQRQTVQVNLVVLGAENVHPTPKSGRTSLFYVRISALKKCPGLKLTTGPMGCSSIEEVVWNEGFSMQAELSTQGLRLELMSYTTKISADGQTKKSFLEKLQNKIRVLRKKPKCIGEVSIEWRRDLLNAAAGLSLTKWVSTVPKKSSKKLPGGPPRLHFSVSITPPTPAPHIFRMLPAPVTDDTGLQVARLVPANKVRQEGRWITRTVVDHSGQEQFVVRTRWATGVKVKDTEPARVSRAQTVIKVHEGPLRKLSSYETTNYQSQSLVRAPSSFVSQANQLDVQPVHADSRKWSLLDGAAILTVQRPSTSDGALGCELQATPGITGYPMRLLSGRWLEYEVAGGHDKNEAKYLTLVRYTPDAPMGKATALINWQSAAIEVKPEESVVLVLLIANAISVSLLDMQFQPSREAPMKKSRKGATDGHLGAMLIQRNGLSDKWARHSSNNESMYWEANNSWLLYSVFWWELSSQQIYYSGVPYGAACGGGACSAGSCGGGACSAAGGCGGGGCGGGGCGGGGCGGGGCGGGGCGGG